MNQISLINKTKNISRDKEGTKVRLVQQGEKEEEGDQAETEREDRRAPLEAKESRGLSVNRAYQERRGREVRQEQWG